MRIRILIMALAMIPALEQSAQGQLDRRSANPAEEDAIELLLGMRQELRLSWHQVGTLREIQRRLEAANQPLVEALVRIQREVRSEHYAVRSDNRKPPWGPSPEQLEIARDPLMRIQANNLMAMESVADVLTERQKRLAATLINVRHHRLERPPTFFRLGRSRN